MAQHNWHWATTTAVVNTLTNQAWDSEKMTMKEWYQFEVLPELEKWKYVKDMEELNGPCVCPRCKCAMDPRRPALSRLTRTATEERIYVCSDCGVDEAILQFHNGGIPVDWRN
jgi:hypothetical protein